jgi:hypothetical protein
MLPKMLEGDRRRAGWALGRAAWRLGVTMREYRELEAAARSPTFETWDRIWKPLRLAADVCRAAVLTIR